tara:strand:- start:9505 stop:9663 length:159 start_codon:yes stop_codon:yes gene_type:complete
VTQAMDSNVELLSVEYAFWLAHLLSANIEFCFHLVCSQKKALQLKGFFIEFI